MKNEFVVYVLQELGAAQQDKLGSYPTIKKARAAIARAIKMRKLMTQSSRAIRPPPQGALECYARQIGDAARIDKGVFLIVGPPPAQTPAAAPQPVVPIPISVRFDAITDRQQGFEAEIAALAADVRALKQVLASMSAQESARVLFENGQPGATPVPPLIEPPPGPVAERSPVPTEADRVPGRREEMNDAKLERMGDALLDIVLAKPGLNRTQLEGALRKRMGAGTGAMAERIQQLVADGLLEVRVGVNAVGRGRALLYYPAEKKAEPREL